MITKERFIEICREAGLYVTDFDENRSQNDGIWAYLSSKDTDGWTAHYDVRFGDGNVFVADCIDYHIDDESYSIYGVGSCMVKDEEKFKKDLNRLITRYKNIKKNLRKKAIEEL